MRDEGLISLQNSDGLLNSTEEEIADKCDVMINIKELDDVLMKDVGGKIKASGK